LIQSEGQKISGAGGDTGALLAAGLICGGGCLFINMPQPAVTDVMKASASCPSSSDPLIHAHTRTAHPPTHHLFSTVAKYARVNAAAAAAAAIVHDSSI